MQVLLPVSSRKEVSMYSDVSRWSTRFLPQDGTNNGSTVSLQQSIGPKTVFLSSVNATPYSALNYAISDMTGSITSQIRITGQLTVRGQ